MTEFVRVRLENNSEASVSVEFAKAFGLKPLDNKTAAAHGQAIPAKHDPLKKKAETPADDESNKEK